MPARQRALARCAALRRFASPAAMRPAATAARRSSHERLSCRPATRARSSISSRACWCASAAAGLLSTAPSVSSSLFMSYALPLGRRRNGCARCCKGARPARGLALRALTTRLGRSRPGAQQGANARRRGTSGTRDHRAARRIQADVIALAARSGISVLPGSVSQYVVRPAGCPVMVAGPDAS